MEKKLTINDVAIKAKSKKEIYYVLTCEGGIYLPPIMDANSTYLKDIVRGAKKFIYSKDVNVIKLPQIKRLYVADLLKWGKQNTLINSYLPTYKYVKMPNRDWLCNVLNTIAFDNFQNYVKHAYKERETSLTLTKGFTLSAIPEITKIFSNSNNISYEKGRSHFILRDFKRKRKYIEIENDMRVDQQENSKEEELKHKLKLLEERIAVHQEREEGFLKDKEKLVILYQTGVINSDGEAIEE